MNTTNRQDVRVARALGGSSLLGVIASALLFTGCTSVQTGAAIARFAIDDSPEIHPAVGVSLAIGDEIEGAIGEWYTYFGRARIVGEERDADCFRMHLRLLIPQHERDAPDPWYVWVGFGLEYVAYPMDIADRPAGNTSVTFGVRFEDRIPHGLTLFAEGDLAALLYEPPSGNSGFVCSLGAGVSLQW